jgi:hypothetical protein
LYKRVLLDILSGGDMGRPTKLPGIWGALAETLTVSGLAEALDSNPRSINNWAHNVAAIPAVTSGRLLDLCLDLDVPPIVYRNADRVLVGCTHEGWVTWGEGGYARRTRYLGSVEDLVGPSPETTRQARKTGWRW